MKCLILILVFSLKVKVLMNKEQRLKEKIKPTLKIQEAKKSKKITNLKELKIKQKISTLKNKANKENNANLIIPFYQVLNIPICLMTSQQKRNILHFFLLKKKKKFKWLKLIRFATTKIKMRGE